MSAQSDTFFSPQLPPRIDTWPDAIRSAARSRGVLVPCGPGYRLAEWPETPLVRALTLAPWTQSGLIATRLTAAWVWGAVRNTPRSLTFSARSGHHPRKLYSASATVQHVMLSADELSTLGTVQLTSPVRTVWDLLRSDRSFSSEAYIACRLLLLAADPSHTEIESYLRGPSQPFAARARQRFTRLAQTTYASSSS